jgi:curved DNA-binding protein CbpA
VRTVHTLSRPHLLSAYSRGIHTTAPKASSSDDLRWPKSSNPSPYEIFGLPPTASAADIKKRYYELAKRYHPDSRATSAQVEQERIQRFRQVVQANELLSAARSRRLYDQQGFGWGDMNVNDIMGDPVHWRGNYEGRYRDTRRPNGDNSHKAQPYYTSNANFAGGIIVIVVLVAVIQLSRIQSNAQKASERRRIVHEQASLNLRDARINAKTSGRQDMIEAFQQRRDVNIGDHSKDELENPGIPDRRR